MHTVQTVDSEELLHRHKSKCDYAAKFHWMREALEKTITATLVSFGPMVIESTRR